MKFALIFSMNHRNTDVIVNTPGRKQEFTLSPEARAGLAMFLDFVFRIPGSEVFAEIDPGAGLTSYGLFPYEEANDGS